MILENWFPTSIWYTHLTPPSENYFDDARQFCIDQSKRTTGRVLSNVGGWQSEDLYLNDIKNTPLNIFFSMMSPNIDVILRSLGIDHTIPVGNIWININGKGDSNRSHTHDRSFYSGVFYLTESNSKIVFQKPLSIEGYHLEQYRSNCNTPLSYKSIEYSPTKGQVLFFPSWLPHHVQQNPTDTERISIAFNIY
jgi:uncharacterized protein (TIGR02466 family)